MPVSVEKLNVSEFLRLSAQFPVIDVRSPGEYKHAHIPGAISLPLFTDEERKVVGTTYKQQSREAAIRVGLDYFGLKMRPMVESVIAQCGERGTLLVHCWRGGMRSGAVAWLLDLYGFKVYSLVGGYKAYRNHVLQVFDQPIPLRILGGFTGTGKTELLQQLEKEGDLVIDLENLACHMGSAFGSYKMPPQPTQEMFENLLASELEAKKGQLTKGKWPAVWVEDESQRIGNLNLPNAFWQTMREAPIIFLEVAFEKRLNHLVEEYRDCETDKLVASVERISKRLGPLETKTTLEHLATGNRTEAFRILLQYYDKRYLKGLNNRETLPAILTKIPCEDVSAANTQLLSKYQFV